MKALIVAGLVSLAPTVAFAEGCALDGGTVVAKVEALNQMMLELDVAGFVAAIKDEIGLDLGESLSGVSEIFAAGFDGCWGKPVDLQAILAELARRSGQPVPQTPTA